MDDFGDAFSRLEAAERELHAAELAFSRDVYRFLVGAATAATCDPSAAAVCARRADVAAALRAVRGVLERCRRSIRVI